MSLYPDMKIVDTSLSAFSSVTQALKEARSTGSGQCYIVSPESRFPPAADRLRVLNGESIQVTTAKLLKYQGDVYCFEPGRLYLQTTFYATESGELIDLGRFDGQAPIRSTRVCPRMLRQYERMVRIIRNKLGRRVSYAYVLPEAAEIMERLKACVGLRPEGVDTNELPQSIDGFGSL